MSQVWVAGEVLIDLIPDGSDRKPIVGGGPANTAKALVKIGIDTQFIDGISTDDYGQMAKNELMASGVKLEYVKYSDKPTCLAIVSLSDSGSASYEFVIENTITFDFTSNWLPNPQTEPPTLLHIGTLATVIEPGASVLFDWAHSVSKVAPIVFDPNVRSSVVSDRTKYQAAVARWTVISAVIKVSEDDLAWLYPEREQLDIAAQWLNEGAALVIITKGSYGLIGITKEGSVTVPGVKVEVADTVGAGDTVGAIVVEAIVERGLAALHGEVLREVLTRAAKAASITCSRAGANPPSRAEIEE